MKDRIRQLMEQQHMTQQTFADFIGVSPATLSSIFNERTRPTLAFVEAVKKKFKSLNTDWLMFGLGDMFVDNSPQADGIGTAPSQDKRGGGEVQSDLFALPQGSNAGADRYPTELRMEDPPQYGIRHQGAQPRPYRQQQSQQHGVQAAELPRQRQITEIRIFYSDQTWETFVPKK